MRCYARYILLAVVAVMGIGQMLAACGQKGPLYLPPPDAKTAPVENPAEAPAVPEAPR